MKKKNFLFLLLGLAVAALVFLGGEESKTPDRSSDSVLPSNVDTHRASESTFSKHRSISMQKMKELSTKMDLAKKIAAASSEAVGELSEDEQIVAENNIPEQIVWRRDWAEEEQDVTWTQRIEKETEEKARTLLAGEIGIRHLSCRETICRMYLQFEDKTDAETFTFSEHDPDFKYEYQLLNPDDDDGSVLDDEKKYNYEVLIKRDRPVNLPRKNRLTTESSEIEIVANSAGEGA